MTSATANAPLPQHVETAIVGSGFGGIATAIKLEESGRGDDVGGTWRDNSYPDCACDVPSHLYSFSFAPNPDWRHTFSRQPQIFDYLKQVATDYGVRPRLRLRTEVTGAAWDEAAQLWRGATARGDLSAGRLAPAVGGRSEPKLPDVPGLESFAGAMWRSASWA